METKRLRPGNRPKPKVLPDSDGVRHTLRGRKGKRRRIRARNRISALRTLATSGAKTRSKELTMEDLAYNRITELQEKVSSRAYPDLERHPGGPDNWVEAVGGLPSMIERIAKHLHYEQGYTISRAIATAVSQVKKICATGRAFGGTKEVNAKYRAQCCAAAAQWEAKKARSHAKSEKGDRRIRSDIQFINEMLNN